MRVFLTLIISLMIVMPASGRDFSFAEGHPSNFEEAKEIMMDDIYRRGLLPRRKLKRRTFYCNQKFSSRKKTKLNRDYSHYSNYDRYIRYYSNIYSNMVGHYPRARYFKKRAKRIEFEHIVPQSTFRSVSYRERNLIVSDLYNIVPAIGEVNALRLNFRPGYVDLSRGGQFGRCGTKLAPGRRIVEPDNSVKGDFARIYFYMNWRYPGFGIVNSENRALLSHWSKIDPVSEVELKRARLIESVQGNRNPFVDRRSVGPTRPDRRVEPPRRPTPPRRPVVTPPRRPTTPVVIPPRRPRPNRRYYLPKGKDYRFIFKNRYGYWLRADSNDGNIVSDLDRPNYSSIFYVEDLNGGRLRSGDTVLLKTRVGRYFTVKDGEGNLTSSSYRPKSLKNKEKVFKIYFLSGKRILFKTLEGNTFHVSNRYGNIGAYHDRDNLGLFYHFLK